LDDSPLNRKY